MTKRQGNALKPGIYKVFWKRGGWSWAAIGEVHNTWGPVAPCEAKLDRYILAYNWTGALKGSRMWSKIAKVERDPLAKMERER